MGEGEGEKGRREEVERQVRKGMKKRMQKIKRAEDEEQQ